MTRDADPLTAALNHPDAYLPSSAHDVASDRRRWAARAAARVEVASLVEDAHRRGYPSPADAERPLTGSTFGFGR